MDATKIASMISRSTGMDMESAYVSVVTRNAQNLPVLKPGEHIDTSPPPLRLTSPDHVDTKEFLKYASGAGMGNLDAIKAICRETGKSFEAVTIESMQPDFRPLPRREVAPTSRQRMAAALDSIYAKPQTAMLNIEPPPAWSSLERPAKFTRLACALGERSSMPRVCARESVPVADIPVIDSHLSNSPTRRGGAFSSGGAGSFNVGGRGSFHQG